MSDRPRLLLDSASLYFRSFYGVPDSMRAPDGTPVNAVRGFLDSIAMLVTAHRPAELVACWDDDWRPAFRVRALPSYKEHRLSVDRSLAAKGIEESPPALAPQVPVIVDVLAALGIARVGAPGFEADDVIGTLAVGATRPVLVVTGDRDLFQLVDDARGVRVLYTAKGGVARGETYDEAAVTARYGIPGRAYADFATLRGDPSDGLPGVPGVGEKTAAGLLASHGSLAAILAALDRKEGPMLASSVRAKLAAARDYLEVAPAVVEVVKDVALPPFDATCPSVPADEAALAALTERWGLGGSVDRVVAALAGG